MTQRQATIYLLWCGSKMIAGDELTKDEWDLMLVAREKSIDLAYRLLRIKPEDYEYKKGIPFQ